MRKFVLTAVLLACGNAAAGSRYPMLKPCPAPAGALCGTIDVPESRQSKTSRMLTLDVMVIPAAAEPAADAVVALTGGGPGIASLPEAPGWMEGYAKLHQKHDMVFFDQRGTGRTNALDCEMGSAAAAAFFGGDIPLDTVARCGAELAKNADLTAYTTADSADDLEAIRKWLGLARINVYGASYTSRLAMVYAQRYPKSVRTVTLKATTPIAAKNPLYVARDSQAALDRLFADCAADAKCSSAYPTLPADLAAVMQTLVTSPAQVGDVVVTRDVFAGVIRRMLYGADTQALVPMAIASARRGELAPIKPLLGAAPRIDQLLNLGDFLSVTCAEDVSQFTAADVERETRGTFTGPVLASALKRACGAWPAAKLRHKYDTVVKGVPALVISGKLDPDTPPVWGREMARLFRGSVHLELEGQAHSGTPPCVRNIIAAFVESGSNANLPVDCVKELRRPAFR